MIPFGDPYASYKAHKSQIDQAIKRVVDSGWYVLGTEVEAFEKEFASSLQDNIKEYKASKATEYFITANIPSKCNNPYQSTLVGFCKLRIKNDQCYHFINSLEDSSIVRELKVYGRMVPVFFNKKYDKYNSENKSNSQHRGVGKELMKIAEIPDLAINLAHDIPVKFL